MGEAENLDPAVGETLLLEVRQSPWSLISAATRPLKTFQWPNTILDSRIYTSVLPLAGHSVPIPLL